ncbi:hypothetical protein Tel_11825 [Candidatus Tenderia electrophaga]|uniref:PilZ domain-containing protein n=1 Tax=Candidatus Tenderia electrophaga TaxID=1748243 RepID=A0A0S2TF66_9GAMM|nr:hypothetical protein Tel_11825 [Candidatus Tenderia electrophaga]
MEVVVRRCDGLIVHGRTRDFSTDGMFIRAARQAVPTNTAIEIEIPRCGCLRGWVVHVGDEGIGVMFRALNSKEKCLLRQLHAENSATRRK